MDNHLPKVLIFYDHFAPAWKAGGPVQSLVNLVEATGDTYQYFVCCAAHEMHETAPLPGVKVNRWNEWRGKAQVFYRQRGLYADLSPSALLQAVQPSVVYINGIYSLHYNWLPFWSAIRYRNVQKPPTIVVAARGMLHPGALAQKAWKKRIFLWLFKMSGWQYRVRWHATDAMEAAYIRKVLGQRCDVRVAGNFPKRVKPQTIAEKLPGRLVLGTIALISPMKNHLAVLEALHAVQGQVEWHIWGPVKEEAYWETCRQAIATLPQNIIVHYHGELSPEATEEALRCIQVFIMPSESENYGHALMEALGAGRPVITTDTTPFLHLAQSKAGITVPYDRLKEMLPDAIQLFVAMTGELYRAYCHGARNLYEKRTDMASLVDEYRHLFSQS